MKDAITIHSRMGEVCIPLHPSDNSAKRTKGDIRLTGSPSTEVPLQVSFLLAADGTLTHWTSQWTTTGNTHRLGFALGDRPTHPATESQRAKIAELWLDKTREETFGTYPDESVCGWAFAGMTPDEVSRKYGGGDPVYLAGPV